MSKRAIWPVLLLFFAGSNLLAQVPYQQQDKGMQAELSLAWGFAQGSFGDNLNRPIPGILFAFGGKTPKLPLVLSTELGWFNYGFDNYTELQFSDVIGTTAPLLTSVNVETSNSILMAHLVARLVPPQEILKGILVPYIDGLIGFKYLTTAIAVEGEAILDDDNLVTIVDEDRLSTSSTFNSLAISYGVGAGVDIRVFDGSLGLHNRKSTIFLHLGARYLFGSEADYLTENSIRPGADRILFEQVESDTNMLIPKLGIQIGL